LQFVPTKARPIIICHHDTMIRPIQSTIPALIALAVGGASLLATAPVHADDTDRALLSNFATPPTARTLRNPGTE
jgi:hypothetical protein